MLRVVLIDGFESAELVRVLESFVTTNGKSLTVVSLDPAADLKAYPGTNSLLVVREPARAQAAQLVEALVVVQVAAEAEVPLRVWARLAAPANLEAALAFYLGAQGIELTAVVSAAPERVAFRAVVWRALDGSELAELAGVLVPLPVEGFVTLRADGGVVAVTAPEPPLEDVNEARGFVASLVRHGQVQTHTPGRRARASHEVVTDPQGQRRLVRLRSADR